MWISGSEFRRLTDICNTIRWTNNRVFRFIDSINYSNWQNYNLHTTTGETGDEYTCDGPDVAQTKDLRDKTGDLVSDLKISDWSGNIYALEVQTHFFQAVVD